MIEFRSVEEAQNYFNSKFPEGALVTVANGNPAYMMLDSSPQYAVSHIQVFENEEDEIECAFADVDSGRVIQFSLESVSDEGPNRSMAVSEEDGYFLISNLIPESQKALLKARQEEGRIS